MGVVEALLPSRIFPEEFMPEMPAHVKRKLIFQEAPGEYRFHDLGKVQISGPNRKTLENMERFHLFSLAVFSAVFIPRSAEAAAVNGGGLIVPLLGASFLIVTALAVILALLVRRRKPILGFFGSVFHSIGQALSENPDVKKLVQEHPRFFSFMGRRLDRESFSGLPATLLGIAFLFLLIQFLGVVQSVLTLDPIVAADLRTANLLASLRTEGLNRFFLMVTMLGRWPVVLAFALSASAILLLKRRWIFIPGLWICLLGATTSTWLGKVVFHRQRPVVAEYVEWSYSFPSGHAVISVALYGYFIYLIWRFSNRWGVKLVALAGGSTVILAIGTSRLYLGVHYLSDVWGGYLVGLMWLIAAVSVAEAIAWKQPRREEPGKEFAVSAASWVIAVAALSAYLLMGSVYNPPGKAAMKKPPQVVEQNIKSIFLKHTLPRFTESLIGKNQEPLSFIIAANDDENLIRVFRAAGWSLASPESLGALIKAGEAAVLNKPDSAAPVTPSFWNGQPHDFGFEKPLKKATVRERHHARFWKTRFKTPEGLSLYVGNASLDVGVKWGITHRIQANIDAEREYLFKDLAGTGFLKNFGKTDFVGPLLGKNFFGDPFFTDGKIYILTLRGKKGQH